jgi:hypothetical protein
VYRQPYDGDFPPPFPSLAALFKHLVGNKHIKELKQAYGNQVGYKWSVSHVPVRYTHQPQQCTSAHIQNGHVSVLQRKLAIKQQVDAADAAVRATARRAQEQAAGEQLLSAAGPGALS